MDIFVKYMFFSSVFFHAYFIVKFFYNIYYHHQISKG